jgi:hypothetical protein
MAERAEGGERVERRRARADGFYSILALLLGWCLLVPSMLLMVDQTIALWGWSWGMGLALLLIGTTIGVSIWLVRRDAARRGTSLASQLPTSGT